MGEILGVNVATGSYEELTRQSLAWAKRGESRAVLFANVHMLMEAYDDPGYREDLNAADLVNPDGMPLVWALRAMGESDATRVYGPDATGLLLKAAESASIPVGFLGGTEHSLQQLVERVRQRFPRLPVALAMSPPFRTLSAAEDAWISTGILLSGARMLFVGLGCPRQERWIMNHMDRIPAVMFGVGAAFDFLGGTKAQAPRWMMRLGLEWLFRLLSEPRRLTGRYVKHNPRFVALLVRQFLMKNKTSKACPIPRPTSSKTTVGRVGRPLYGHSNNHSNGG